MRASHISLGLTGQHLMSSIQKSSTVHQQDSAKHHSLHCAPLTARKTTPHPNETPLTRPASSDSDSFMNNSVKSSTSDDWSPCNAEESLPSSNEADGYQSSQNGTADADCNNAGLPAVHQAASLPVTKTGKDGIIARSKCVQQHCPVRQNLQDQKPVVCVCFGKSAPRDMGRHKVGNSML